MTQDIIMPKGTVGHSHDSSQRDTLYPHPHPSAYFISSSHILNYLVIEFICQMNPFLPINFI
jgi:hypothetical protein